MAVHCHLSKDPIELRAGEIALANPRPTAGRSSTGNMIALGSSHCPAPPSPTSTKGAQDDGWANSGGFSGSSIPIIAGLPINETTGLTDPRNAFPDELCRAIALPIAIDYREFAPRQHKLQEGRYHDAWFTLLAEIYGLSRAAIEERERRRRGFSPLTRARARARRDGGSVGAQGRCRRHPSIARTPGKPCSRSAVQPSGPAAAARSGRPGISLLTARGMSGGPLRAAPAWRWRATGSGCPAVRCRAPPTQTARPAAHA